MMARLTGLEPATPGVTGRYSNQLSYNRADHFPGSPSGVRGGLRMGADAVKAVSAKNDGAPRKAPRVSVGKAGRPYFRTVFSSKSGSASSSALV